MTLARHNPARDKNEREVIDALRGMKPNGCSVERISGAGVPDLLVGYMGHTLLREVKGPKGKLTPAQRGFFNGWTGCPVVIVRSGEDAVSAVQRVAGNAMRI